MNRKVDMNRLLKILAVVLGLGLLIMSMGWSKDGFKFDFATGVDADRATTYGYILAASATTLQFIFSTKYRELNLTLLALGLISYIYSIGTNLAGIALMQGGKPNAMTWILALIMDVSPEPMIAWGLGNSLSGDFIGNLIKSLNGNEPKKKETPKAHRHHAMGLTNDVFDSIPKRQKRARR